MYIFNNVHLQWKINSIFSRWKLHVQCKSGSVLYCFILHLVFFFAGNCMPMYSTRINLSAYYYVGSLLNVVFTYRLEFLFIFSFLSISTFTRNPWMDASWIHSIANTKLSLMSVIQLLSVKRHVAFLASPSHFPRLHSVIAFKMS